MEDYSPEKIEATKAIMQEKTIKVIDAFPQETSVIGDQPATEEITLPKYLAPRKIEVKRYILKK